ncbi:short transient receptor potential channel 4-associated protein-like [Lingula anatina]|nr:short transient receptor potential channel 4-associated protein-like [Lingula anatina]|eukprot:XP_013378565.1 short transient receptor potential channel 4-associated protein-like [Lingula anatina]
MFLRSLILSLEHFTTIQPEFADYVTKECHLLKYLDEFGRQVDYLHRLVNIINVQTLTQENVSCLNTTLVFLMFANRRGELPKYLSALREEKYCRPHEKKGGDVLMKNFRDLLLFWQEHYLHKDKDCSALEKSSRISFDYWKKTVTLLVDDDRNQHTSVLHYIPPDKCRDN